MKKSQYDERIKLLERELEKKNKIAFKKLSYEEKVNVVSQMVEIGFMG